MDAHRHRGSFHSSGRCLLKNADDLANSARELVSSAKASSERIAAIRMTLRDDPSISRVPIGEAQACAVHGDAQPASSKNSDDLGSSWPTITLAFLLGALVGFISTASLDLRVVRTLP